MLVKALALLITVVGVIAQGDSPPPKFYCFQAPGAGRNIFTGGFKSCPKDSFATPKRDADAAKICMQTAMCMSPTPSSKKQVTDEISQRTGKKVDFDSLEISEVTTSLQNIADKAMRDKTEPNFIAPMATLICKAEKDDHGEDACPPPNHCKDDFYYGLEPQKSAIGPDKTIDDLKKLHLRDFYMHPDPRDAITK